MKCIAIWIMLILLLSACVAEPSVQEREYTVNQSVPVTEEDRARERTASEEAQRVMSFVRGNQSPTVMRPEDYPDCWAGCYINSEFNLVVMLTKEDRGFLQELREVSDNEDLCYEIVEHSYGELLLLMDEVSQKSNQLSELGVVWVGLETYENCVGVGMKDISPEYIEAFRNTISDSELLSFTLMIGEFRY